MRTRLSPRGGLRNKAVLLMAAIAVWLAACLVLLQLVAAKSVGSKATVQIHRHQPWHPRPPARRDHAAQGQPASMLTVCMTACTPAADWQSIGLYYSFLRSAIPYMHAHRGLCLFVRTRSELDTSRVAGRSSPGGLCA